MDARRPFVEGIEIEEEDDGSVLVDFDPEEPLVKKGPQKKKRSR